MLVFAFHSFLPGTLMDQQEMQILIAVNMALFQCRGVLCLEELSDLTEEVVKFCPTFASVTGSARWLLLHLPGDPPARWLSWHRAVPWLTRIQWKAEQRQHSATFLTPLYSAPGAFGLIRSPKKLGAWPSVYL